MALSKPIKKENSNKFEPVLNVDYDVRILGFCEIGTQSQKDFNSKDEDATIEEEQIGVALQFIGYTEEGDDDEIIYHPCVRKFKGEDSALIETYTKKLSTGAKSFIGNLVDSANKKARGDDGSLDITKAIGKLLTMRKVVENIGGKDLEVWKSQPMAAKLKADVEILHDEPLFLFDLTDGEGGPGQGFVTDDPSLSAEFPQASGMRLVSAIINAGEYADYIEGTGCVLDEVIAELLEEHGTFDSKPEPKKKSASRKAPAKKAETKKPAKKVKEVEPEDEEETEDERELREFKEMKAAKAAKAAKSKKVEEVEGEGEGEDSSDPF